MALLKKNSYVYGNLLLYLQEFHKIFSKNYELGKKNPKISWFSNLRNTDYIIIELQDYIIEYDFVNSLIL